MSRKPKEAVDEPEPKRQRTVWRPFVIIGTTTDDVGENKPQDSGAVLEGLKAIFEDPAQANQLKDTINKVQYKAFLHNMKQLNTRDILDGDCLWYSSAFFFWVISGESQLFIEEDDWATIASIVMGMRLACKDAWACELSAVVAAARKDYPLALTDMHACSRFSAVDTTLIIDKCHDYFKLWVNTLPKFEENEKTTFQKHLTLYLKRTTNHSLDILLAAMKTAVKNKGEGGNCSIIDLIIAQVVQLSCDAGELKTAFEICAMLPDVLLKKHKRGIHSLYCDFCAVVAKADAGSLVDLYQVAISHKGFIKKLMAFYISGLPENYKVTDGYLFCKNHLLRGIKSSQHDPGKGRPGFHLGLPAIEACLASPSAFCADGKEGQLQGDGYHRLYWMLTALHGSVVTTKAATHFVVEGDQAAQDQAMDRLKMVYGERWVSEWANVNAFCEETDLPFAYGPDTHANQATREAVVSTVACLRGVTNKAMGKKSSRTGLVIVRPPGHHDSGESGSAGFCMTNYVALEAIARALEGDNVVVVDIDVHSGDGTMALILKAIQKNPELADKIRFINLFEEKNYPYNDGVGYNRSADKPFADASPAIINCPYRCGTTGVEINAQLKLELEKLKGEGFAPDLALYSIGMDSHRLDDMGEAMMNTEDFVTSLTMLDLIYPGIAVVGLTEGGYNKEAVIDVVTAVSVALTQMSAMPYGGDSTQFMPPPVEEAKKQPSEGGGIAADHESLKA